MEIPGSFWSAEKNIESKTDEPSHDNTFVIWHKDKGS